ncbi:MAG: hypothetical protein AAFQ05_04655 [Pseudomonadota bacterium]
MNKRNHYVLGYAVGPALEWKVQQLYAHGARCVYFDTLIMPQSRIRNRPSMVRLLKSVRPGDVILISDVAAIGDRPSRRETFVSFLKERGVDVFIGRGWLGEITEMVAA